MPPQFVLGSPLLEAAWAGGILLVFVLGAWLILLSMRYAHRKLAKHPKSTLLSQLLAVLYRPVFLLIVAQGLVLALSSASYLIEWRPVLAQVSIAVAITLVTYGLARSGSVLLAWYLRRAKLRQSLIRMIQRFVIILTLVGGLLILLDYLGISISPMIAGLGLGGLAIALALQPTLSNFFAGAQIVSDRMVKVGDYIELEDGTRGYITDIGWRSTRMRTPFNNMVIIPNSRLVNSIITNYFGPTMELGVIVNAGVSYSSDLAYVESIAMAVAWEVVEELDEAVKTFDPWFGYEEFGESNINFWVWVQAKDRIGSFRMKSELIKRLHARFNQEGITINYPVRTTYLKWQDGTQDTRPSDAPGAGGSGEKG